MSHYQLGDIAIDSIVEHDIPVYHPLDFFAEATDAAVDPHRQWLEPTALCKDSGLMVMPVLSYLVRTERHCILLDTCCGCNKTFADPPEWHPASNADWLASLDAHGVQPEDVDYVICTHLHSDHCGWNTQLVNDQWLPTFPNARYLFTQLEYDDMERENHQIFIDNVLPIMQAGQAQLVALDYVLDDQIWLEPTLGHSAGHVAIHLRSGDQHAVMCGDLIHTPLQLAEPSWSPTFEYDIAQSTQTRLDFLAKYCDCDTLILTAHFPLPSMGYIVSRGDSYDFRYIEVP